MSTKLPTLYKYTAKDQIQQWTIMFSGDSFWTEEGIKGGTLTTSLPTRCKSKNVGRSNETSPKQQAEAEARAKWQKKIDGGYNEVLTKEKKFVEPMLAHELSKYEKLLFTVPTFIQPKLDGLRCISEKKTLMSRNGKAYNIQHLFQSATTFDGELYNHEYCNDFNKIVSLCKKQTPNAEEQKEQEEKVEFWAYDLPNHKGKFSERYEELKKKINEAQENECPYRLVPTYPIKNRQEMEKYNAEFLELGYEGSIIRLDLGDYENKRSKQLLKYKEFVDEEFTIVAAEEGEGGRAGTIGFFVMAHDKVPGKTFKSNVKGDFEYLKDVWKNAVEYIGTKATVKYFNRTPDDIPRFPYIIKLNRAEYEGVSKS